MAEQEIYKVELVGPQNKIKKTNENGFQKYWRPAVAVVYLLICIFDFIIAPSWVGLQRETTEQLVKSIKDLPTETQIILATDAPRWEPLTLMGGGFFHIAFGAIITGAAVTRGMEKTARAKNENKEPPIIQEGPQEQ